MIEGITLEKKLNYAILKVDIPATRNALSVPIVEYMDELVEQVIADKAMRCLIITGGGPKSFIAGADISGLDAIPAYVAPQNVTAFEKFNVFTKTELESRVEIEYETYAKTINIEAKTMIDVAGKSSFQ